MGVGEDNVTNTEFATIKTRHYLFFGPPWQALGLTYDPTHDTSWNVYPNAAVYTS